jgi:hypothetical protein
MLLLRWDQFMPVTRLNTPMFVKKYDWISDIIDALDITKPSK